MLANTLNTNEVKDSSAAEVEFTRLTTEGRKTVFAKISESLAYQHRITISHSESGTGINKIRRSVARVDITTPSTVDTSRVVVASSYLVIQVPIGGLTATTIPKDSLAELLSFVGTTDGSTLLHNGTGTGAAALLSGGL
jgi:hypothetical protein